MATLAADWLRKVFRLRSLPNDLTTPDEAAAFLSSALQGTPQHDIDVKSLATAVEWENPRKKVATLQFKSVPELVSAKGLEVAEWDIPLANDGYLTLDCHFLGLTPLNDVEAGLHQLDCIAVSGLASHPFASWQPHGPDKSFMWIRDEFPTLIPGVRAILYGYDSRLVNSICTQTVRDLSRDFIEHLKFGNWNLPSAKPLAFLAHSLGGIVLKDALVQIAGANNLSEGSLIDNVRGAVMFGVPNLGLEQSHLMVMIEGQPNEALVEDLSRNSNYLRQLDQSFSGIAIQRRITMLWGYETSLSPTVVRKPDDTGWDRSGPAALLVSTQSATRRLDQKSPSMVFPIHENHTNMVKFPRNSMNTKFVAHRVASISGVDNLEKGHEVQEHTMHLNASNGETTQRRRFNIPRTSGEKLFTDNDFVDSLGAPDLDARAFQITEHYQDTFEWIFDLEIFTNWLQKGTGIFWINGKPASGKSTLMKFIHDDGRTRELLHNWRRNAQETQLYFFFNFRGSAMEKSLEGVLRSLVRQLLWQHSDLFSILRQFYPRGVPKEWDIRNLKWSIPELENFLRLLLSQTMFKLDLCLFFDALDEFQGHSNLIISFLNDLVLSSSPLTQIKVCFSSRPWSVFAESFRSAPQFTLQDHTKRDIQIYCAGMVSKAGAHAGNLHELVPEIVRQAAGVFLWVKLVINDLIEAASPPHSKPVEALAVILTQLPKDLDQYYEQIVARIPRHSRWEAYVLLDTIVRSNHSLSAMDVIKIVAVSAHRRYPEAEQAFKSIRAKYNKSLVQKISSWSGGLVEIKPRWAKPPPQEATGYSSDPESINQPHRSASIDPFDDLDQLAVQVMHQTVFEFVATLRFKEIVLDDMAQLTWENGHSFLFKYLLIDLLTESGSLYATSPNRYVFQQGRNSELSTGRCQGEFLSGVPSSLFSNLSMSGKFTRLRFSRISFIARCGLLLCLREALESRSVMWLEGPDCIVHQLLCNQIEDDIKVTAVKLLLDNGYPLSNEREILDEILCCFVYDYTGWFSELAGAQELVRKCRLSNKNLHIVFGGLLEYGANPNRWLFGFPALCIIGIPVALVKKLLDFGADSNATDDRGLTSLDILVTSSWNQEDDARNRPEAYQKACLIVAAGGLFSRLLNDSSFREGLQKYQVAGYDTAVFSACWERSRQLLREGGLDLRLRGSRREP